jgi:hypothetical protein
MMLMHSDAPASDDSLSPLLGRGEGGGEGQTFSRLNPPLTPALSPLRTGRGSRLSSPPAQMPSDQNAV